jgi:glycosyltransferase involved in cell wall biosynthesis
LGCDFTKLPLHRTEFLKYESFEQHDLSALASQYHLFINFSYQSRMLGNALKNVYLCMFPPINYHRDDIRTHTFKRSYDYFIAISDFSAEWFLNYWGATEKLRLVYPPVFAFADVSNRCSETAKENIILSVGRFFMGQHAKKQDVLVDFFIKHYDQFAGYELHLAGGLSHNIKEDVNYVESIRKRINGHPIFLHIDCSTEKLHELYRHAKIFWHATGYKEDQINAPEKLEHFGITTVEAMSFGVIPVVINAGGQKGIIAVGENGYTWDTEEECITNTLKVMHDETLRATLARNAMQRANDFSVEKFYARNAELFSQL